MIVIHVDVIVTVALGTPVDEAKHIVHSYAAAREALKYRFFYGPGALLTQDMLGEHTDVEPQEAADVERAVLRAAADGQEAAIELIRRFVSRMPYDKACAAVQRFSKALLGEMLAVEPDALLSDVLDELYARLCALSGGHDQRALENANLAAKIIGYIDENYPDSALSVQSVADAFGVSISHVNRLLKAHYMTSFLHYLTQVRLNQACLLLENTRLPLRVIGERVGVNSAGYLATLFKKHLGITPRLYRLSRIKRDIT